MRAVVNVTTDKCYDNRERARAYRESDPLGGRDPYSSSKACAELVTAAYRDSFLAAAGVAVATARAGNVIGGGDWAADRLVPDFFRACDAGPHAAVRYPEAVRPWQHVLEPLAGYLLLAQRLVEHGRALRRRVELRPRRRRREAGALGARLPGRAHARRALAGRAPGRSRMKRSTSQLDSAKARTQLGWAPRGSWPLRWTARSNGMTPGAPGATCAALCLAQIEARQMAAAV